MFDNLYNTGLWDKGDLSSAIQVIHFLSHHVYWKTRSQRQTAIEIYDLYTQLMPDRWLIKRLRKASIFYGLNTAHKWKDQKAWSEECVYLWAQNCHQQKSVNYIIFIIVWSQIQLKAWQIPAYNERFFNFVFSNRLLSRDKRSCNQWLMVEREIEWKWSQFKENMSDQKYPNENKSGFSLHLIWFSFQ